MLSFQYHKSSGFFLLAHSMKSLGSNVPTESLFFGSFLECLCRFSLGTVASSSKDMHVRLTGGCKLAAGVNVSMSH